MSWDRSQITMIQRYEFSDGNNETISHVEVTTGDGCFWLKNLWTHRDHRQQHMATLLVEEMVERYQNDLIFTVVNPYTNCPMSRKQLTSWLAGFGFEKSRIPGVLFRVPGAFLFP